MKKQRLRKIYKMKKSNRQYNDQIQHELNQILGYKFY